MPIEVLREMILKLTEPDRLEIVREAEVSDDRPSLLRGRIARSVYHPKPLLRSALLDYEIKILPKCIDHYIQIVIADL